MCMCFTPKLINFVKPSFMLNNNVIPYVKNCKYLGIVIHLQSDLYDIKKGNKNILYQYQYAIA